MNFTNLEFFILLPFCIAGYWILSSNSARKFYLLGWSYYFYAWWDYRFLALLILQTVIDYSISRQLNKKERQKQRKLLLILSLSLNLCLLAFFKYSNFFIANFDAIFGKQLPLLHILLPLGISFYTFRAVSYMVDVYNGRLAAASRILDYALFLAFFPVMVAGPIVRAYNMLPQFAVKRMWAGRNLSHGVALIVLGLFQKIFVADRLASFVGPVFENAPVYGSLTCWLAVLAYTLQIYLDFLGYSNMAIGTGKLFGYDIPINFNWPYLATSMSDFWRRWHITLSTWIRDYLYIPLGGNRKGPMRTNLNLLLAMILCGLWHGAGWTFVLWGFYHGLSLVIQRIWHSSFLPKPSTLVSWFATQLVVVCGWVLFRADSATHAGILFQKLFFLQPGVYWPQPFVIGALLGAGILHLQYSRAKQGENSIPFFSEKCWYTPAVIMSMLWLVIFFPPKEFAPFVYAQF